MALMERNKNFIARNLTNRFFIGVMDVEVKSGTIDNMEIVDTYRVFNNKFVNSPELALLVAFDENNERWKTKPEEILKDVIYLPETMEWKRVILETTNGHLPTKNMIEKWKRGEYILNVITEYVQVMETYLVGDEFLTKDAIDSWNEKMKVCTPKCKCCEESPKCKCEKDKT